MAEKGTVIKSTGSQYVVRAEDGSLHTCRIKGKMRLDDIKSTNPVAVGDYVMFEDSAVSNEDEDGSITELLERKNYVVRKSTNLSKQTHVLAANVDQALLVVTVNFPVTTPVFIDRFLASAEAYGVPVVIVFNKIDRYTGNNLEELETYRALYESMGYTVIEVCAKKEIGLDKVKEVLKDKVSVVAGHSGVGKSTLINRIEPGLNLKTDDISEINNSGKHTTTHAEMHKFSFGGYVIDTPGIRGFGIANIEKEEIAHYFRDIFKVSSDCQYGNCTHLHEPGCAVKLAVEEGRLALSRYQSYVNIFESSTSKYR
ncbi:MAG: ribosome small subunit-dependent GTPase A [Bacteroidales bacterium]|nr:ribosome small subunit-dependent GTPase A [Bacteroidales bacterium]